jgi:hypothetical protein
MDNVATAVGAEGGGLYACGGTIENNVISGNSVIGEAYPSGGGGLAGCNGKVRNNLITANSSEMSGGGLAWCGGRIESNTVYGNTAVDRGGGLHDCYGTIINCILWGNTAPEAAQLSESSNPTYSCIERWTGGGEGNVSEDPQFVDPDGPDDDLRTYEDNDYRLADNSPCIDTGENPKE